MKREQALDNIRQGFGAYFDTPGVELPSPFPSRGKVKAGGWRIAYIMGRDEKKAPYLDFFAENRMTNSRHVRILANGESQTLENYQEALITSDTSPEALAQAEAAHQAHNRKVTEILRAKRLLDD